MDNRGMGNLGRLLSYVRPYWGRLVASVVLMAIVGVCHAMIAVLIGPVFDRVLNPQSADAPVQLFRIPGLQRAIYLHDLLPEAIHNIWTMVAVAILVVF